MSYINKQTTGLVKVKLTDIGRELLAKGQLTFAQYIVGDSEVDYDYVKGWSQFVPSSNAATGEFLFHLADGDIDRNIFSKVLRPKDDQPFPSSFLLDQSNNFQFPLNLQSNIQLIKAIVSNEAEDRGFFSGTAETCLSAETSSLFIKEEGTIDLGNFNGGTFLSGYTQGVLTLDTPLTATSVNDYIMFRFSNSTLGNITGDSMCQATVNTFYNITSIVGSTIRVDRELPILTADTGTIITYYTLPGGDDPLDSYYGLPTLAAYWNTGTLSFDSSCDICVDNIPVWNMNNVWTENFAGLFQELPTNYNPNQLFGSEQYAGTKQFLGYNNTPTVTQTSNQLASSYMDPFQKGISIIHYTNSCISNFYGEMFYIDEASEKLLSIDIPVMWHRRNEGTGSGTTLGMTFVSDVVSKTISTNNTIEYYDLIESSGMTVTPDFPMVVGKVFPDLKIVVIDNEELVAAMSYKSNRNYTLPDLSSELVTSSGGGCTGCLNAGHQMYLTYWLSNTSITTTPTLPCQRYTVIQNNSNSDKDVSFRINDVGQLPYMRKTELPDYDGFGFFADGFNLLAQSINPTNVKRPDPSLWRVIDFTSPKITSSASTSTTGSGETINPLLLENQGSVNTGFLLTGELYNAASGNTFNLGDELDMQSSSFYDQMTFGDERLFYGNLRTFIGATIYKTLFTINVDGATMAGSSNTTYSYGKDRYITEVGILDNNDNLVIVGKLSRPVRLANSTTATIELTIDF
mgnify:CR=1 FL=1|tara:strand:+ start:7631 stop:9856 length:2226 start_codon:yes stop_codon:yes gene_type:complete